MAVIRGNRALPAVPCRPRCRGGAAMTQATAQRESRCLPVEGIAMNASHGVVARSHSGSSAPRIPTSRRLSARGPASRKGGDVNSPAGSVVRGTSELALVAPAERAPDRLAEGRLRHHVAVLTVLVVAVVAMAVTASGGQAAANASSPPSDSAAVARPRPQTTFMRAAQAAWTPNIQEQLS